MDTQHIAFIDNPAVRGQENRYKVVTVSCAAVLKSWKVSLFSFEWLYPDGTIRTLDDLPVREREKRQAIEDALRNGKPLERPILGMGLLDAVEIGSGRDVFLTLTAHNVKKIPVHISAATLKVFLPFIE